MRMPFCGHSDYLQDVSVPLRALQCVAELKPCAAELECPAKVSWVMQLASAEGVNVSTSLST